MELALPDITKPKDGRHKEIKFAREQWDNLVEMAPYLRSISDEPLYGLKGRLLGYAWRDCTAYFRDIVHYGDPLWMGSRQAEMVDLYDRLYREAHKRGFDVFKLD